MIYVRFKFSFYSLHSVRKTFFLLFNNNHKPKTYNIFGLLSHKNIVMKLLKIKKLKIGWKIQQINYCLYRLLFNKIRTAT